MSLINKMLQELDRRHALQPAGVTPGLVLNQSPQPVRGATRMVGSEWFWRVVAVLILITIGWIAWVAWQLTPRASVTELAFQPANRAAPAPASVPVAAAPPAASAAAPAALPPSPMPVLQADVAKPEPDRPDMLKLAREILTPLRERDAGAPADTQAALGPAPKRSASPAPAQTAEPPAKRAIKPESTPAPSRPGARASGQIDKRDSATPRDRAAAEFRRAVSFVNQGRIAEGMETFRAALTFDPTYEVARQTQVSLLLEAKRMDEAASLLQEGISLDPANAAFVMLLARILVERNDVGGALALLQQHAAAASDNADYHAFAAALYQRLGRHGEAVNEYGAALRVAPASGLWWVGLGISQEAQQRAAEAADSFRRAKETGTLSTELAGFVDRRLKALH
ncbi:MAG: tetratricopeptide repeat protein [Pseudomonadota bacterium]